VIAPVLVCLALAQPAASSPAPPSVVLITLDTTRADHLGCYGSAQAATPRLDELAGRGIRFEQALSPVPLTLPAHASLLTGRVPRRHGVRDNAGYRLPAGIPLLTERLKAAGYTTAAFVSAAVLDRDGGLARGFATYDDTVRIGDRRAFDYQERAGSQTVDAALPRIAALPAPFFLWIHFYDPHLPYLPPEPYASRFKARPYDGEIAFMDAQIGRVLDALKKKRTSMYVAVAGDHGESLGEHGEDAHGVFLYQATQHVPLILTGPHLPAGSVVKYEVGLVDVAPTLLELLHLPALAGADGRSLLPLIRGEQKGAQDYEMETLYPSFSYGWAPLRAFCSGSYKYIEAPRPELYELPTDPGELHDLSQKRAPRATELRAALADRTRGDAVAAPADDPETSERRDRLASLGYVSGSVSPATGALDPKDGVKLLGDLDAARHAIQLGDPKDALAPLTRLIAKNPGNIPARLLLGQAQLAVGKSDDAVATYRAVTGLAPNNALAWFNLGNAHAGKAAGDDAAFAEAKRCYDRAVLLSPRHADTYLNLAALYAARKDPESSRQTLLRARAALVSDPTLETELGLLEAGRKDAPAARAAFERALVLNPRQAEALEGMGQLDYAAKDYAAAAGYYERALAAYPATSIAKTLGAIRLYQLNDRAGARAAFSRALALAPAGDPDVADLQALIDELGH
jgi:arylsulfatase A-like enzyme/tetratricopeptide (TPR) repeat protein